MKSLTLNRKHKIICRFVWLLTAAMVFWMQNGYATPLALADSPLFLSNTATPIVMLNISKDHQLYFKAYDDFSDLDGDGVPDTTYKNSIDYYGYFDSYKCYTYNTTSKQFEPSAITSNKYCTSGGSLWSGNFLNWASMSRIDTIRKILYGGYRSTDTGSKQTSTTTTAPVTSAPVATGSTSAASAYVLAGTALTNTTHTTTSGTTTNCSSLPITSAESAPSADSSFSGVTTGIPPNFSSTNSTPTNSTPTDSTPVVTSSTSPLGTTTTTTYNTTYNTIYTTTTPVSYKTKTYTTTYTVTSLSGTCHSNGNSNTTIKTYTNTYTKYYISSTTTPYQTTTTTTTTTISNVIGITVLERSYIPNDAHSFAKFYNGSDLSKLTPFTSTSGITLCNTTVSSTTLSQNVIDPPLIRVAAGNYSLWNANERWQCRWSEEQSATNGNVSATSGISAYGSNPSNSVGLGSIDYVARVKVCDSNYIGTESCKTYTNSTSGADNGKITLKPTGLLQTYGDNNQVNFGLLTGSYGKNKSGGVLRKNASSMNDEINVSTDGTFKTVPSTGGIINTLNKLRMYGYCHTDGTYFCTTGADKCSWGLSSYSDGSCTNWGNPQSEMFLESLRYLTNHSALSAFYSDDTSYFSGLTTATPTNPIQSAQWCAKLNVIEFNASSSSYDGDQLSSVTDIGATAMNSLTDAVGTGENLTTAPNNVYFVGSNGTNNDQLCTPKSVSALSSVSGTCPDAPRLSGTYQIDGLAEYAHTNDLLTSLQGTQEVTTYGVALSPVQPVVTVPVPGSTTKTVKILPACQDTWNSSQTPGNCTLVDFKIVNQVSTDCSMVSPSPSGTANCGKIYVNWEDSEQGGDFDMDMWGVLTYAVTSTKVQITTQTIYKSTPYLMGFGYILGGTNQDGFHAHSGINGYAYSDTQPGSAAVTGGITYCTNCNYTDAASTVSYQLGTSSASSLQQPLFYAAKWGGFNDYNKSGTPDSTLEWDANNDGIPDRYFYATNPAALASSLAQALNDVIRSKASASAAAANSTSLNTGTVVYQAQFDSTDWSGHFYSFPVQSDGSIKDVNGDGVLNGVDANWDAATLIPAASARNIFTYNPTGGSGSGGGTVFQWPTATSPTLSTSQTLALQTSASGVPGSVATGQDRLNWLRGDTTKEERNSGGVYRNRTVTVLGDIVNSDPIYTYTEDYGYASLPSSAAEQASYANFVANKLTGTKPRIPMVYDGANDGMLHGFRADINNPDSGKEIFAYVPAGIYGQLSSLTDPGYAHKYFVDGSPTVSDAYLTGGWSTVLLGGLGKGGKTIYALDISNPTGFTASNVMWEYSGSTAAPSDGSGVTDADGMGLTYSQPQVAKMNDGTWVAIFGNGYNSASERAFLYIVNLNTGVLIKKIATNTAIGNGLSTPVLYDNNNDKIIDVAYAGDLRGNLWKFDLSGSSTSWQLGNGGSALFSATDGSGKAQPITAKPVVGGNPSGGVLIYFGTGSYLTNADVTNTDTQSFYAIWDYASTGTLMRGNLVQQTIDTTVVTAGTSNPNANCSSNTPGCVTTYPYTMNSTSTNTVDYAVKRGWFMDLAAGERIYSSALLKYGRVIFLSSVPSNDPCVPGGYSWLTELDMLSGGATTTSSYDLNNDGQFNASDKLPSNKTASRVEITGGMGKTPVWLDCTSSGCTKAQKLISITSGGIPNVGNQQPPVVISSGVAHRKSWLQLQ